SFPFSYATIAPGIPAQELDRQARRIGPALTGQSWRERAGRVTSLLRDWVNETRVPMLVGAIAYDHQPTGYQRYNAALLFQPGDSDVASYHKLHLVPFGEYVPFLETLPWLTALTPYDPDNVPTLAFGARPVWFDLGGYRYATAICFEDTVPHLVRRLIGEVPDGRRPDVVLNLSNDGWFVDQRADGSRHKSSEHEMHLVVSVFRAIEHRIPLARSANTGVSAIVDGNGRVVRELETLKEGVVSGVVPLDGRRALYTAWGDWLGLTCLAVTLGLIPLGLLGWPALRTRRAS
ncbi:MAG: apolipoprotein N-acyltransferase, partial [Isosphaeraceae bacterium]